MARLNFFWKIFLAITLVMLVSFIMLTVTLRLSLPGAFEHHSMEMRTMMNNGMGMMGGHTMVSQLYDLFSRAVTEALWVAVPIAIMVTLLTSWIISRLVTAPAREIFRAAEGITAGDYQKRIPLPDSLSETEMDDLQRMAAGFNRMAESLENTENRRRQLIGDISHELRTPLTTIKGSMEGLIDGVLPPDEATFQQIHKEAARLQRLVDDLQELSRIEGGNFRLIPQSVSIQKLAHTICSRLQPQFESKGVLLQNKITTDIPTVQADPDRLEQILINLLNNALRHTPAGGQVSLENTLSKTDLTVSISDAGSGISPEHLPHLFTRFYRADPSRARSGGGSGIGLTITKHLVEAHGGKIEAYSDGPGKGSRFSFTLPL